MLPKKVCFINPPTTDPMEGTIYFPMALLTLGGVLKKMGIKTTLWDFDLYFKRKGNTTEKEFRNLIHNGVDGVETNIFGISSICSNFPMALWIAKEIKEHNPKSLIILGGPQPSSVPMQILERFNYIDAVVVGEGEKTLEEMAAKDFDKVQLAGIPGVAARVEGKVVFHAKRTLVQEMDELPYPDYTLINFRDYQPYRTGSYQVNVEVGRGCPFHCTFCSTALMWENQFRVKSPKKILEEMEWLHREYGFTFFDLIHDNFTTSRKFLLDFCEYMKKNNVNKLKWFSSSRTDCIDVPRLELMYEAGVGGLFFGIETGSDRMQQVIKKNLNFERFEPILKRGNELNLVVITAFILGFPEEEIADIDQTILRALRYKAMGTPRVYFGKLSALTGTSIYRENLKKLEKNSLCFSTSPQHYALPYIRHLIDEHPDLFSSFYHVPSPNFSKEFITKIVEFAHFLVNADPEITLLLIEKLGFTPSRLFSLWDTWAQKHGINYIDFRIFNENSYKNVFQEFLDEAIFYNPLHHHVSRPQPLSKELNISEAI